MDEREIIGRHLGFRTRTVNALLRGRGFDYSPETGFVSVDGKYPIKTLAELAAATPRKVLRIAGAGKRTLQDCEKVLRAHGFTAENSELLNTLEQPD